jgi:oxalate---CoA ligase
MRRYDKTIDRFKLYFGENINMNKLNELNPQSIPFYPCMGTLLKTFTEEHIKEKLAICAPGRNALTYNGLQSQITETVAFLNDHAIGRNDAVAVVIPNGPEMAVAFVSIMAGATCAPLNPKYQATEYEFYLNDLEAKALVLPKNLDSPARDVAKKLAVPVIDLIAMTDAEAGRFQLSCGHLNGSCDKGLAEKEDIALVLHTSGTTSRPKIVPLSQENIFTSAHNVGTTLQLTPKDRCLNVMPLFHIHGLIAALMASLNTNGSVVCSPGFLEESFFSWVEQFQPTWYTAVPTIHQSVLAVAEGNKKVLETVPLRFIRSSSSSLPPQVMNHMEELFDVPVVEAYGMTEAAHQMTCNPLPRGTQKPGSVGQSAGPEVALMDKEGLLLPQEETGEIVIKGRNVTKGYKNNPQANRENFTNGWFRTGDQGRFDSDGYLYITGRLKEQINQGGEKISPREIDEALMDHEAVHQAVAFGIPHKRLGEAVAAAVVLKEGERASEAKLKSFASKRLADHKVPRQIVFLDKIPKGPTGKLQRIGLHEKLKVFLEPGLVPPETETEYRLAAIWSEILNIDEVGRFDNFFIMGGDSILATRAVSRINEDLKTDISISQMFLAPTPGDLGYLIDEAQAGANNDDFSQLLTEIEDLSDEEAQKLLDE